MSGNRRTARRRRRLQGLRDLIGGVADYGRALIEIIFC